MDKDVWLECNTLDGTWYYMNVVTGETLPAGVQPIYRGVDI